MIADPNSTDEDEMSTLALQRNLKRNQLLSHKTTPIDCDIQYD